MKDNISIYKVKKVQKLNYKYDFLKFNLVVLSRFEFKICGL